MATHRNSPTVRDENKVTFCICRVRSNHAVPVYVQYRTGIHTHCIIENKIYKNYVIFMLDTL